MVSTDGSAWTAALAVEPATGVSTSAQGARIDGPTEVSRGLLLHGRPGCGPMGSPISLARWLRPPVTCRLVRLSSVGQGPMAAMCALPMTPGSVTSQPRRRPAMRRWARCSALSEPVSAPLRLMAVGCWI